jgi:hypothetical protein
MARAWFDISVFWQSWAADPFAPRARSYRACPGRRTKAERREQAFLKSHYRANWTRGERLSCVTASPVGRAGPRLVHLHQTPQVSFGCSSHPYGPFAATSCAQTLSGRYSADNCRSTRRGLKGAAIYFNFDRAAQPRFATETGQHLRGTVFQLQSNDVAHWLSSLVGVDHA